VRNSLNEFKKRQQQEHSDTNSGFICRLIILIYLSRNNVCRPMCVLKCGKEIYCCAGTEADNVMVR